MYRFQDDMGRLYAEPHSQTVRCAKQSIRWAVAEVRVLTLATNFYFLKVYLLMRAAVRDE